MTPAHARPDSPGATYQVGRRNAPPMLLAGLAVMWMVSGLACELYLHTSWKLIPVVVAFGIGVLYLRASAGAYLRQYR
ncbi:hypothetical protein [Ferrimicrobium sp.]|uniref:hypothetical protein n=1 Tax=Ferrimicrobium sp. TaxID=2926050 RepID=UPI002609A12C|nr:hypothetical protein [Ferrimicrobium sp.]